MQENMFPQQYTVQNSSKLELQNMFRQQYTVQNTSKLEQRATATSQQVDAGEHVSPAVHCTEHQQIFRTEVHSNNKPTG